MSPVSCSFCDKSFVNKYSLSSHKSRYHRENGESETSSTIQPLSKATSDDRDVKMDYPASTYSDADTTITEVSHQDGSNREEISDDDDESKTKSSNNSVSSSDELEYDSVRKHKGKRKGVALKQINKKVNNMSKILKSVDVLLQSKLCKEEDKCIDFLFSYIMKTELFEKFEQHLIDCGQDIATIFSMEERAFLDAVITTGSLSDVNKLMNENVNILKKMLKLA